MDNSFKTGYENFTIEGNLAEPCPLCQGEARIFSDKGFFLCKECKGIFRDKQSYLSPSEEKKRYEKHNNDVNDKNYQQFVSPITEAVLNKYSSTDKGLDFGAGTGPVICKLLKDKKYSIEPYDPFFHDHPELLNKKYDYIVCCEVMEHFHSPGKEFRLLKNLLKPNGTLYCMTHLYSPEIAFENWYYKNDPTHVFIFQKHTVEWIKINFGFSSLIIHERLIKLTN
jgi:SAM-dependent methyltransferase